MTILKALKLGAQKLNKLAEPQTEAELLLALVLKTSREKILTSNHTITPTQLTKYNKYIAERSAGKSLAYLSGTKFFYSLKFKVNKNVLVPRPETESLIDLAKTIINKNQINHIVDIGTGSGCIALTLATLYPNKKIIATDISAAALQVAKRNAATLKIKNVNFIKGDNFKPLINKAWLSKSLVISNPPYLLPDEINDSLKFEPKLALVGGNDGLEWYKFFINILLNLKLTNQPNFILLEIHSRLSKPTLQLFKKAKLSYKITLINDLATKPRFLRLEKRCHN